MIINALGYAGFDRLPDGEWRLHSRFNQAINYCRPDGTLLTLFRYGKGMGPTGVLLKTADFSCFRNVVLIIKQGDLLWSSGVTLRLRRRLRLRLAPAALAPVDLSNCSQQSGLSGALNQPVTAMPYFSNIIAELERWHRGANFDWRWLVGRGPGLTPSGDDVLTGMMAVLHASRYFPQLQHFLPPGDQLTLITTSVSCSYLNSARIGEFSTPMLKVMRCLQSGRNPRSAIRRLLQIGHTSGADILLGIAVAQWWLQMVDLRGMHARSGNNTYVYTGG
ncbi:DUF2877 domain-containing protein [Phytobacter sp. V91]|uniref:DUF2877 domain-containing protein n=1 Tax=Phytobacter sp. V91 TaxID=3369425 RepID=UPI003F63FA80